MNVDRVLSLCDSEHARDEGRRKHVGSGQENIWSIRQLEEVQQAVFGHGGPKLPDEEGDGKPRFNLVVFVENVDNVGVRGK